MRRGPNTISVLEYKFNNLTGSETEQELLAYRATADKYPTLNAAAVALLDVAIDGFATALTNSSTAIEINTVAQASAEKIVEEEKLNAFVSTAADIHASFGSFCARQTDSLA